MDCFDLKPNDICVGSNGCVYYYVGKVLNFYEKITDYIFVFHSSTGYSFNTNARGLSCSDDTPNIIKKKPIVITYYAIVLKDGKIMEIYIDKKRAMEALRLKYCPSTAPKIVTLTGELDHE